MLTLVVVAVLVLFSVIVTWIHAPAAATIRSIKDKPFRIEIWGTLRPEASFRLDSARALGAGLHIRATADTGSRIWIKVAQPRDVTTGDDRVTIGSARYIQVDRRTVPMVPGTSALRILPLHADRTGAV